MTFNEFLDQAWADHAQEPEQVASRFYEGTQMIRSEEQVASMAHLIGHVMGEHMGQWQKGIDHLNHLKTISIFDSNGESAKAVARGIMSLEIASGLEMQNELSNSDRIRALAMAASALSEQDQTVRAEQVFKRALEIAKDLPPVDPANRTLAATGHNLACGLEETPDKTLEETALMILAAQTSRKYWEVAGTWLEVGRAEYRLAQSYLDAKDFDKAGTHAQSAIQIAKTNSAAPLELFSGYEVLAKIEKAKNNQVAYLAAKADVENYFSKLSEEDQAWCRKSLEGI